MKKLIKVMMIMLIFAISIGAVSVCAQTKLTSPQTILWDLDEIPIGDVTFMVYLAPLSIVPADRNVSNMIFIAEVLTLTALVDVESTGLQGKYAIALQTHRIWEDIEDYSTEFAFSDVAADADLVDGPFYLLFVKGLSKPKRIKIQ